MQERTRLQGEQLFGGDRDAPGSSSLEFSRSAVLDAFSGRERAVIDPDLVQRASQPEILIFVMVGRHLVKRRRGVIDGAALGFSGGRELAIDIEPHLGAIVGAGDVIPLPGPEIPIGGHVGHRRRAAGSLDRERKLRAYIAQDPSLLVAAVVLEGANDTTPGSRLVYPDPGLRRDRLHWQVRILVIIGNSQAGNLPFEIHRLVFT